MFGFGNSGNSTPLRHTMFIHFSLLAVGKHTSCVHKTTSPYFVFAMADIWMRLWLENRKSMQIFTNWNLMYDSFLAIQQFRFILLLITFMQSEIKNKNLYRKMMKRKMTKQQVLRTNQNNQKLSNDHMHNASLRASLMVGTLSESRTLQLVEFWIFKFTAKYRHSQM